MALPEADAEEMLGVRRPVEADPKLRGTGGTSGTVLAADDVPAREEGLRMAERGAGRPLFPAVPEVDEAAEDPPIDFLPPVGVSPRDWRGFAALGVGLSGLVRVEEEADEDKRTGVEGGSSAAAAVAASCSSCSLCCFRGDR